MRPVPVLPPPLAGWPSALRLARPVPATPPPCAGRAAALAAVRADGLWWPALRRGARRGRALALSADFVAAARAAYPDAAVLVLGNPADVDPDGLEAVFGPPGAAVALWAALGGLRGPAPDPSAILSAAEGRSPWTGDAIGLAEALEAQALMRRAALRPEGRAGLVGMSPWKRRCLRPFLVGPDGPPRAVRSVEAAFAAGLTPVVWGADAPPGALGVEDGFLRSVGLGVRHAPPLSLVIGTEPPHFDATRPNGFARLAESAAFDPTILARAAKLRARIVELALTKYNLDGRGLLPPDPAGRQAVLVVGQVAGDASIRLGAFGPRDDLGLLRAARARFPDAFLLYRPHPDVTTGLRGGGATPAVAAALADATAPELSAEACLGWADRVVTITSLMGFEALLRGKPVTVLGRPFYAGWGLTDDADPFHRGRRLTLDELTAAALILYPAYVDPQTGLPAPPELVVEALAAERRAARRPAGRALRLWRAALSELLNRL